MRKDKLFVMFSDLDNTIIPTDEGSKKQFAQFAMNLKKNNNVNLKLCPISGRDSGFVSNIMNELSKPFSKVGLIDTIEMGAGEQGGVLVFKKNPKKNRAMIKIDENLKKRISDIAYHSDFSKFFLVQKDLKTVNVFYISDDNILHLSNNAKMEFFQKKLESFQKFLHKKVGSKVKFAKFCNENIGVLEVVPNIIGKDIAIKKIFEHYQKKYNIVGFCYCGDHENDLKAIDYVSRLAEVPGIKTHVFIPRNAQACTKEPTIKKWQDKMSDYSRGRVIKQGDFDTLEGILDVMKKEYDNGTLINEGQGKNSVEDMLTKLSKRTNKSMNRSYSI